MAPEISALTPSTAPAGASANKLAVYWDFENVHASLGRQPGGSAVDAKRVQVDAVLAYLHELGDVLVHRAYADWRSFSAYAPDLLRHALDLVQLFPRSGAKNGADIRLALDALEDLHLRPELTHLIVVGSDSDFVALAQKVRQAGKIVIGIGMEGSTSPHWMQACNQFVLYHELPGVIARQPGPIPNVLASPWTAQTPKAAKAASQPLLKTKDLTVARALLRRAMEQLERERGEKPIDKGLLKGRLLKLEPAFRERAYGFATFRSLMNACADMFVITKPPHGQVTLRLAATPPPEPVGAPPEPPRPTPTKKIKLAKQPPHRAQLELVFDAPDETAPKPPDADLDHMPR